MTTGVRLPYRNPSVEAAVSRRLGVQASVAAVYLEQVVEFLDAGWEQRQQVPPSREVDEAWHELITHTRDYLSLCRSRYGAYAHHDVDDSATADASCSVSFEPL